MTLPEAPLRLRLDDAALVQNWRALDRLSGAARAGAAVKADGYGLGAARVVRLLAAAGCRDFYVAHASEAAALDGLVDPDQVVILHGPQDAAEAAWIAAKGFRPVLNSLRQVALWSTHAAAHCDLMVDTGINRIGLSLGELADPAVGRLITRTVHSHLASADEDSAFNAVQLERWQSACNYIGKCEFSLANSAGIMLGAAYHGHVTRPGIALYGGVPRPELVGTIRQVAYPEAAIIQVRDVAAGDGIGYNSTFVASAAMRVGVIALGYADGYLRCWSGQGAMRTGDTLLPVLGRVSMDMTVIDLSAVPDLREGDWVTAEYDLPAAAKTTGLSQYELLTVLGRRFAR